MTVIAAILSFVFMGKLVGVREGTIIAALLVGFIVRFIGRKLSFLPDKIFDNSNNQSKNTEEDTEKLPVPMCIAIGR